MFGRFPRFIILKQRGSNKWRFGTRPLILAIPLPMMVQNEIKAEPNSSPSPNPDVPHPQPQPRAQSQPHYGGDCGPPSAFPSGYVLYGNAAVVGVIGLICGVCGYVYAQYAWQYESRKAKKEADDMMLSANTRVSQILMLGRAGIGKSHLVNAVIGKDVCVENSMHTGTYDARLYKFDVENSEKTEALARLQIWDTVGFFRKHSEDKCVEELRKAENCDALILGIDGSGGRIDNDIERLAGILNKLYRGQDWVNRCVVVVTKCNQYEKLHTSYWPWKANTQTNERQQTLKKEIVKQLQWAGLSEYDAKSMPVIWARKKTDNDWIKETIVSLITRAHQDGKDVIAMVRPDAVDDDLMELLSDDVQKILRWSSCTIL